MINILKQYKILCIVSCVIFLFLIIQGPYLQSDSGGYLQACASRGLFYPLFLKSCRLILDNLYWVVFVQLMLGLSACIYTINCFEKFFEKRFSAALQISLFVTLVLPYVGHSIIGNTILTEPLAYPLFLLFFCQLLLFKKFENTSYLLTALGIALCLMLTRKQFAYIFASFYVWIFLDLIYKKKFSIINFLLPIFFFTTGLLIEKSYMFIKTGHFIATPAGQFIIASPLFVAKVNDVEHLKTPEQKSFLTKAIEERDKQKLGMHQEQYANFSWPYHKKFEIVHDILRYEITSKSLLPLSLGFLETEQLLNDVTFTVLKNNLGDFFKVYSRNLINNMGGYYYFYLVCCAFLVCLWQSIMKKKDFLIYFGLIAITLNFLNFGVVAIFLPVLQRFAIYTNGLMICFWLLCLHQVFVGTKND